MGSNKYIITKIKCWPVFKQDPFLQTISILNELLKKWVSALLIRHLQLRLINVTKGSEKKLCNYLRKTAKNMSIFQKNDVIQYRSKVSVILSN